MSRALVLTAGVICGFLVAGFAMAASDARTPRRAATKPRTGEPVFVVTGHGWGHGVGMAQWGANGFARRGMSYNRILAHYYRGTTIGRAPVSKVRVLLASGKKTLTIASAAPFRVRAPSGKVKRLAAGKHVIGTGLKVKPKGAKRRVALDWPVVFLAGEEPLRLDRRYRGAIQVDVKGGRLRAINVVGLEQYLYGVVPSEVPDDWPAEVLKAQAVAARSYAVSTRKLGGAYDLFPDVRSQVYRGIDEEEATTNEAVQETAGEVVMYQGRVARTYFHSSSGGRTASATDVWPDSGTVPYLVSVDDPYDTLSPHHLWGPFVISLARMHKVLKAPGRLVDVRTTVNASARVPTVIGVGSAGEVSVRGADFRPPLDLVPNRRPRAAGAREAARVRRCREAHRNGARDREAGARAAQRDDLGVCESGPAAGQRLVRRHGSADGDDPLSARGGCCTHRRHHRRRGAARRLDRSGRSLRAPWHCPSCPRWDDG